MSTKISDLPVRLIPLDEDLVVLANDSEEKNYKITLADLKIALGDLTMASLTTLLDTVGEVIYVGKALPGTSLSSPNWSIQRVTTVGEDLSVEWADSGSFSQVWNNRFSLSYT